MFEEERLFTHVDLHDLLVAMNIRFGVKSLDKRFKAAFGRIAELIHIENIEWLVLKRSAQYLFEVWTIEPWTKPVRRHIGCIRSMILASVDHGKGLGKSLAESRYQPILVIVDGRSVDLASLDEVTDAVDNKIGR